MTLTSDTVAGFALRTPPPETALAVGRGALAAGADRAGRGADSDAAQRLLSVLVPEKGSAAVTVATLGPRTPLPASEAAMVSGVAMDAAHPGAGESGRTADAVAAAAVSIAQVTRADVAELVAAVTVGAELAFRLADGLGAGHRRRGWDVVGTTGPIGAAAAAGRLLKLEHGTLTQALGIAATQGAGVAAASESMAWSLHVGRAAAIGVEAALLAANGLTGPVTGIEGRRGLAAVIAPEADLQGAAAGLGEQWRLAERLPEVQRSGITDETVAAAIPELHEAAVATSAGAVAPRGGRPEKTE